MTVEVAKYMTQAEYARHRGVKRSTVHEYKTKGQLVISDAGLVDVAASDDLLDSVLDSRGGDRTGSAEKPSAKSGAWASEKVVGERIKNARQLLLLEKEAGKLIERAPTVKVAFDLARGAQEKFLSIPDRVSSVLANESDAAKIHLLLTEELVSVCNELAQSVKDRYGRG